MKLLPLLIFQCALAIKATFKEPTAIVFNHTHELYKGDYNLSFSWTINPTMDTMHALLQLTSTLPSNALAGSYISLGIGSGMLDAHFIISKSNLKDGIVDISEYFASGSYSSPQLLVQSLVKVVPVIGGENVKSHWIEFIRPLDGFKVSRFHDEVHDLDIDDPVVMIWAFNPNNGGGTRVIKTHDVEHRGRFQVHLTDGSVIHEAVISHTVKLVHGYGMLGIWMGLMPFGIFIARYCRSKSGWLLLKIMNQAAASILTLLLFFYVLTSSPVLRSMHSILGLIVLLVVLLQIIFGITATMGMSVSAMEKYRRLARGFHMIAGWGILIIAVVTCAYGIDILYPFSRFQSIWYYFFSLLGLWTVTFICAETYYQLRLKSNSTFAKVRTEMENQQRSLRFSNRFTWESINREVKNGRMYVVAHGKYMSSHPGGQLILQDCCGTDITNDYFHEAGFDAKDFNPKTIPSRLLLKKNSSNLEKILSNADTIALDRQNSCKSIASVRMNPGGGISFEKSDWKHIQRARRTHVHTKLAIEKLSSLMVGTMIDGDTMGSVVSGENNTVLAEGQITFSEFEYRRYAMTKKTIESDQHATIPFFRLRFCLLYPYDHRAKQPRRFQPGQCIELEFILPDGKRISRFYTPLNGDLNAFEIMVKLVPGGKVSSHLFHSIIGDNQYKIRGPFGTPFAPTESLGGQEQFFDTIYGFAGGSGITPFLQLTNHLLLPLLTPLRVGQRQDSYQAGELYLDVGDYVEVTYHFLDGWAFGTNMKTGEQGTFSLNCIVPFSHTRIVLFHFSESHLDYMGKQQLEMAQSIYPHLLQVHFLNSRTLAEEKIAMHLESTTRNIQVIVCGPVGLNTKIVDILSGFGEFWIEKLRLMRNNSWC